MNVLIFQDLFFYMKHITLLGIIRNRSFSLLSKLHGFYDTHAISNLRNETGHLEYLFSTTLSSNVTFTGHLYNKVYL